MRPDITKHSKKTQFTTKRQPTGKAKSKGIRKFYERKRFKDDIFSTFCKIFIGKNGKKYKSFEASIELMQQTILNPETGLDDEGARIQVISQKERCELFIKFCGCFGIKEGQIDITSKGESIKTNDMDRVALDHFYKNYYKKR